MTRPTRETNSAPPPPGDSESPRDTARSAADEEANTTGLTGAPDPDADSSDAAARRDRAAGDGARARDGVRGRLQSDRASAGPARHAGHRGLGLADRRGRCSPSTSC